MSDESSWLIELVEASDLDGLVRFAEALVSARRWEALVEMRERCLEARERGKQLAGPAAYADYRLALDAPAEFAGAVVAEGRGMGALGPLWEVAASTHSWDELAPHVAPGPMRALAAHERVVRGEDLTAADGIDPHVLEVPLRLLEWEPAYPVAVYRPDGADFPAPSPVSGGPAAAGGHAAAVDDHDATDALYELVRVWCERSNGVSRTVAVEGDAAAAVAVLGSSGAGLTEVDAARAVAAMAWAGASGGAHGPRRGTPVGRANAWWAVAVLAGFDHHWPADGVELGAVAAELNWYLWEPGDAGWSLHLAVEDREHGLSWAIAATDRRDDHPPAGPS